MSRFGFQGGIDIGNYFNILNQSLKLNTIDANAIAYLTASGITDATRVKACSNFVKRLKAINSVQLNFVDFNNPSNGVLQAVYPWILGNNFNSRKFNLINPIDADNAYRLTSYGTFTHTANYIQSNGIDARLDTHFTPSDSNAHHFLSYFRSNSTSSQWFGSTNGFEFTPYYAGDSGGTFLSYGYMRSQGDGIYDMPTANGLIGFNIDTSIDSTSAGYNYITWANNKDLYCTYGLCGTGNTIGTYGSVVLFARRNVSTYTYSSYKSSFVTIGGSITATAYILYQYAIQQLHVDMNSYETITDITYPTRYSIQNSISGHYRNDAPSIVKLSSNNYLIAWNTFPSIATEDSGTAYITGKTTSDDFATFSNNFTILRTTLSGGFGSDQNNLCPSLYKKSNGNIINISLAGTSVSTSEMRLNTSIDNGGTWGNATKIYGETGKYYSPISDCIFKSSTGKLFYSFAEHISGSTNSATGTYTTKLLYSNDDGDNWTLVSGVEIISPDNLAVEPRMLQKSDNTLVVYFRTRSGTVYASNSTDDGVTFGTSYNTNLKAPNSTTSIIYSSRLNKFIAIHNFRVNFTAGSTVNGLYARTKIRISTSSNFTTWTKFIDLDQECYYHFIEPTIIDTGSDFVIIYSRGDKSGTYYDLAFKRVNIT